MHTVSLPPFPVRWQSCSQTHALAHSHSHTRQQREAAIVRSLAVNVPCLLGGEGVRRKQEAKAGEEGRERRREREGRRAQEKRSEIASASCGAAIVARLSLLLYLAREASCPDGSRVLILILQHPSRSPHPLLLLRLLPSRSPSLAHNPRLTRQREQGRGSLALVAGQRARRCSGSSKRGRENAREAGGESASQSVLGRAKERRLQAKKASEERERGKREEQERHTSRGSRRRRRQQQQEQERKHSQRQESESCCRRRSRSRKPCTAALDVCRRACIPRIPCLSLCSALAPSRLLLPPPSSLLLLVCRRAAVPRVTSSSSLREELSLAREGRERERRPAIPISRCCCCRCCSLSRSRRLSLGSCLPACLPAPSTHTLAALVTILRPHLTASAAAASLSLCLRLSLSFLSLSHSPCVSRHHPTHHHQPVSRSSMTSVPRDASGSSASR